MDGNASYPESIRYQLFALFISIFLPPKQAPKASDHTSGCIGRLTVSSPDNLTITGSYEIENIEYL